MGVPRASSHARSILNPAGFARERSVFFVQSEQIRELAPCPVDPALDRTHGATANLSGFFVGATRGADERQHFTVIGSELLKGDLEVLKID